MRAPQTTGSRARDALNEGTEGQAPSEGLRCRGKGQRAAASESGEGQLRGGSGIRDGPEVRGGRKTVSESERGRGSAGVEKVGVLAKWPKATGGTLARWVRDEGACAAIPRGPGSRPLEGNRELMPSGGVGRRTGGQL